MDSKPLSPVLSAPMSVARFTCDVVFACIATFSVLLRLYCRHLKKLRLGMDDYMVLLALLWLYAFMARDMIEIFQGYSGHHVSKLNLGILEKFLHSTFAGELVYPFSVTFARISINLLFIRVYSVPIYRRLAYTNIGHNVGWCLYSFIAPFARCQPLAKEWDPTITYGHCANLTAIELVIPVWGLVCDLFTWILPLPLVWRLQMSLASRIGLSCVFAIGLVVIGIGGARIATIFQQNTEDITYGITTAAIIAFAEPSLSIFCACGPLFRPAMDKFAGHWTLKNFLSSISLRSMRSQREQYANLTANGSTELQTHGYANQTQASFGGQSDTERTLHPVDLEESRIGVKRDIYVTKDV